MQMNKILKRLTSGVLALILTAGTLTGYHFTEVKADYSTNTSGFNVTGNNVSTSKKKGDFVCDYDSATWYRITPVILPVEPDKQLSDYMIPTDMYYRYRELSLYTCDSTKINNAIAFNTAEASYGTKLSSRVLNTDGSFDFSAVLGVDLKGLPNQDFKSDNPNFYDFQDVVNNAIKTSGEDANIVDVFTNYINYLDSHQNILSETGKAQLTELKSEIGYGTDYFTEYCNSAGLVVEVGSFGDGGGNVVAFSWQDLCESGIGKDCYFIWNMLNTANTPKADGKVGLTSWSATYNKTGAVYTSEYRGLITLLLANVVKKSETRSQAVNIAIAVDSEIKANMDAGDIKISKNIVTSAENPDVNLGNASYIKAMKNIYNNALADTSIVLDNGVTVNTEEKSNTLKSLSGSPKRDYTGLSLLGYDVLQIPIKADSYSLSAINNIDIDTVIDAVTAKTEVEAVSGGFGNLYSVVFRVGDKTVRNKVAGELIDVNGVSEVAKLSSKSKVGTVENMADLQGATLLSGKIEGKPSDSGLTDATGEIYASIAYLAKDKEVTSKSAEVFVNKNAGVEIITALDSQTHSVTESVEWGITGKAKSYTYAIAFKASDYRMTDEKELTESILSALGDTYVIRGRNGANTLSNGFKQATGKNPIGIKYITNENSIEIGASAKADDTLTGIHLLIINVSQELPVKVVSEDYIASNELNYVYPDLLGYKSSVNKVKPIAANSYNVVYPYTVSDSNSGDLVNFKGSKVHYYYEPTGLFGVFTQSTKYFEEKAYPSYAYNISRALWGDNLVASNYRGISAIDPVVQSDIKDNLGLSVGVKGKDINVTCEENVDAVISTTKSDEYKFNGKITLDDESVVDEHNNFKITHYLNKYACLALNTAVNANAGKAGFNIQDGIDINNKITMVTQSNNIVAVYPEVAYKYYQTETTNGVLNNTKPLTVYVMGEKARMMKPSSIRGIGMEYMLGNKNVANGDVISDGALVGSMASSLGDDLQVIPQGTNITMKAEHGLNYRLISYSLDIVDTYGEIDVRNGFSSANVHYKPAKEHEDFVQEFMENVDVTTYMNIGNKEYEMKTDNTNASIIKNTDTTYLAIEFKDGKINESSKNSVINNIAAEYGITVEEAKQVFESAGFEKQLQDMFESNTDENNGSNDKWYDEESVTICIRKYVTVVDLGELLVQDKIDYGTVSAIGFSSNGQIQHRATDGYFTMSVSLPEEFNECNLKNANKLFEKQKIKNTEFKVSSSTTADFDSSNGDD